MATQPRTTGLTEFDRRSVDRARVFDSFDRSLRQQKRVFRAPSLTVEPSNLWVCLHLSIRW